MNMKASKILVVAALLVSVLGGCYMPVRFDAEIKLSRNGFYDMIFDGYMVSIELYDGLQKGEISKSEEEEKVARIKADLTRDSAVSEFKYIKLGHFKTHWEKKGDLLKAKMVTFLRRNEKFLTIKYVKTSRQITIEGVSIASSAKKQLDEMGLGAMVGEIRVITDARVREHNATKVKGDIKGRGEKTFIWKLKTVYDPSPKLVLTLR